MATLEWLDNNGYYADIHTAIVNTVLAIGKWLLDFHCGLAY